MSEKSGWFAGSIPQHHQQFKTQNIKGTIMTTNITIDGFIILHINPETHKRTFFFNDYEIKSKDHITVCPHSIIIDLPDKFLNLEQAMAEIKEKGDALIKEFLSNNNQQN